MQAGSLEGMKNDKKRGIALAFSEKACILKG
jgi:hypothetical protein